MDLCSFIRLPIEVTVDDTVTDKRDVIFEYSIELIEVTVTVNEHGTALGDVRKISVGVVIIDPTQNTHLKAAL